MNKKIKMGILFCIGIFFGSYINNKCNNISNKLDVIISVSNKSKIDSLEYELMNLGSKLDSMMLKYDYDFTFTN